MPLRVNKIVLVFLYLKFDICLEGEHYHEKPTNKE